MIERTETKLFDKMSNKRYEDKTIFLVYERHEPRCKAKEKQEDWNVK